MSRIDQDHWAVGIRGFADQFSKSMLVLVDGRSLYTPLFAGVYWALQDGIMLEDVERIEVIRGPGATIWGANAVNGVINIITKSAKDTHGTTGHAGGGNIDQGIAAVPLWWRQRRQLRLPRLRRRVSFVAPSITRTTRPTTTGGWGSPGSARTGTSVTETNSRSRATCTRAASESV